MWKFLNLLQIRKKINSEDQPPQRPTDEAFDNLDELRTVDEMRDILADRHRVKLNSLIGNYIDTSNTDSVLFKILKILWFVKF